MQKIHTSTTKCVVSIGARNSSKTTYQGWTKKVSGRFVDVLDKLRRIIKHTKGVPSITNSQENTVDGFQVQASKQGLEA